MNLYKGYCVKPGISKILLIVMFLISSYNTKTEIIECLALQEAKEAFDADNTKKTKWESLGWSISKELFDYIRKVLPEGSTMLELGSGWASGQLSKFYTLYSVEHDPGYLNRYETNYIYAPIKNRWYDPKVLEKELPSDYELILIDGPPGPIGRYGFFENLRLFKTNLIIIFDDVHRKADYKLMVDVAKVLGKKFKVYSDSVGKKYGIIDNR